MSTEATFDQNRDPRGASSDHENLTALDTLLSSHHPVNNMLSAESIQQFVATFQEAFPDLEFNIQEMISAGDRMVIHWEMCGTHDHELMGIAPTGKPACLAGISIYRLEEGRAVECWNQIDLLNLLVQLEVLPD